MKLEEARLTLCGEPALKTTLVHYQNWYSYNTQWKPLITASNKVKFS